MPVYSSHLLQYADLELGRRIRQARQAQGLTLRHVAKHLRTSSARLSQIENERLRLSLEDVLQIADAIGVPVDVLIPADVSMPFQITRDADQRSRSPQPMLIANAQGSGDVPSPHEYWPLANLFVGRHLEPVLARIMPASEREACFCYHHEEEFAFVLRGRVEFRIKTPEEDCVETLERGDCVYFRSDLPHRFRSLDSVPADTIHVFCSPSVSTHGAVDWSHSRAIAYSGNGTSNPQQRQIGAKLTLLHEEHGWSFGRLARTAALSDSQMIAIERGDRAIPLEALLNLARGFGKPLRELIGLAGAPRPYYFVRRLREIASIPNRHRRTPVERPHAARSKTCQPLVAGFPAAKMYPYFLRMLNVELETLTLHEHNGQEFIYVLEGELELTTYAGNEEVHETLRAGDACYLDSSVPHLLRSWTRNPYSETSAEVLDVFWCPLGETYLFDN